MSVNRSAAWLAFADAAGPFAGSDPAGLAAIILAGGGGGCHHLCDAIARWHLWRDGRQQPSILVAASAVDVAALAGIVVAGADGIVLTGCRNRADIQALDVALGVAEAVAGRPAGTTTIVAECATTTESLLSPHSLAGASPRLRALIFDAARLGETLGLDAGADLLALDVIRFARVHVIFKGREAGIPVYEVPVVSTDPQTCCARSRGDGFAGIVARLEDLHGLPPCGR